MTEPTAPISLVGQVYKVQTLVDGGIRLTIDLPESAAVEMGRLAYYQINGVAAEIEISQAVVKNTSIRNGTTKRSNKQP